MCQLMYSTYSNNIHTVYIEKIKFLNRIELYNDDILKHFFKMLILKDFHPASLSAHASNK